MSLVVVDGNDQAPAPNENCIQFFEALLEEARRGMIRDALVVIIPNDSKKRVRVHVSETETGTIDRHALAFGLGMAERWVYEGSDE